MPRNTRRQGGGRILPHQRDTDDTTPVLGANIELRAEHRDAIVTTEGKSMEDKCRRDYRNRIKEILPGYFEVGTKVLTVEEKADNVVFHWKNDHDLIYSGINVDMIKAFLGEKKVKLERDGVVLLMHSFSHIRKYDDAIKWGAAMAGARLSQTYYSEMDRFLSAYRKEYTAAKKEGKVDEKDADPITISLFSLICQWAVDEGNTFVWVFSLAMWNLMSRSISVDSLAFHNLKRGASDSVKFQFDETKTDKTGEFVTEKNCYANPCEKRGHVCFFTALAVWISLNAEVLELSEKLFIRPGAEAKSASQRYCRQLAEICGRHFDEVKKHLRFSRFNAHGIRKGSGTHASSATTLPPSFVAVAARGEWSIGKVLDVYFKFAMGGDQYLGRILALLDPNDTSFATLPPHWKDPEHESVKRGLKVAFGNVLERHKDTNHDPSGLLSLLLASMVHHSDWIQGIKAKHPDHPFGMLPLLDEPELLKELKDVHLTLEANEDVPIATGVPPHVAHSKAIKEVFDMCTEIRDGQEKFREELAEAVSEAVDKKVESEGGLNMALLTNKLDSMKKAITDDIAARIDSATAAGGLNTNGDANTVATDNDLPTVNDTANVPAPYQFYYPDEKGQQRYWCVPQSFHFPKAATRSVGWRKWLVGSVHVDGSTPWKIRPFRLLKESDLHSKALKNDLKAWRGIFKLMEKAVTIPNDGNVDAAFVASSFATATDFLKENYSFSTSNIPSITLQRGQLEPGIGRRGGVSEKRSFKVANRRGVNKVAKRGRHKRAQIPPAGAGDGQEAGANRDAGRPTNWVDPSDDPRFTNVAENEAAPAAEDQDPMEV
ncbi:hypothetical protein ACHAXT_012066 [Thalassiosira profunda]